MNKRELLNIEENMDRMDKSLGLLAHLCGPQEIIRYIIALKVPYHKKHIFSGHCIYKLVLPEPADSQNEENE